MIKESDYLVSQVMVEPDGQNISLLYLHQIAKVYNRNYQMTAGEWKTESEVLRLLSSHNVYTLMWNYEKSCWEKGERVISVKQNNRLTLSTSAGSAARNSLLSLIRY